jgi:aromatic ring-opening dioxygenase LigB subunit
MSLLASYIVPHPPLIVPDIGRGEERKISKTIHSYQTIAKEIGKLKPDTIIIISPHDINYRDGFNITKIQSLQGNLNNFGSSIAFTKDRTNRRYSNNHPCFDITFGSWNNDTFIFYR